MNQPQIPGPNDEYIERYTTFEGGPWRWFPYAFIFGEGAEDYVEKCKGRTIAGKTFIGNVQLHSFRTNKGREWDCLNGWRVQRNA